MPKGVDKNELSNQKMKDIKKTKENKEKYT